ncbi:MAG: NAD(P)-dependent oxidoreductase [Fibromonadales bacterium]|nr:NAD(P)-dependent oxidoreductase [Fibromonadales bacterium]
MKNVLITGGAGFFGGLLKQALLDKGIQCVSIDLEKDNASHENLTAIQGDIRNMDTMRDLFKNHNFDVVFHCAAILAHAVKDKNFLWTSNVDGTKNVAELALEHKVKNIVFLSSNCLWAQNFHRPVTEEDTPAPVEIYGKSKLEGEKILEQCSNSINTVIFRCPTIIDCGRLGLLSILFEFIDEGRKVWVVGGGENCYQFIYAQDLIDACIKAASYEKSNIFNIGSENVKSFREVYDYVIHKSGTKARVASLPKKLSIFGMKLAYALNMSPLGPYQYKMIAEDFEFDISKIKRELNWAPTMTNEDMLYKSYKYYHDNRAEINSRKDVSAHKQSAKMGIIRLLKWLS